MPAFHDFSENGKLLNVRDEPLDSENFTRYLAEYGTERILGYRDAISDLVNQIDKILDMPHGNGFLPNSPSTVRTELRKLYHNQQVKRIKIGHLSARPIFVAWIGLLFLLTYLTFD